MSNPSRYTKRDWKAITHNYDRAIATPTNARLICLSDQEIELLLGCVEYLRWPTRYYSPLNTPIDKLKVLYVANEIERALMAQNCNCGGGCGCQSAAALDVLVSIEWANQDAAEPGSYAPNTPDTTYDTSTTDTTSEEMTRRGAALCYAVDQYVNRIIQEMINRGQAAGAVLLFLGGFVSIFLPMAGFVISMVGGGLVALVEALDNNEQAIKDVKCCMVNGLKNKVITPENFAAALGGCGFTFGSDEAQLSAIVNANSQDIRNFRAFNVLLEVAFPSAGQDNCDFCNQGWCYELDLTADDESEIVKLVPADTSPESGYVAGTGYVAPWDKQLKLKIVLPATSYLTNYAVAMGAPQYAVLSTYNRDGTLMTVATDSFPGWASQKNITDTDPGLCDLVVKGATVTTIFIKGHGVDPFNSSNCDGSLPWE